MDKEKQLVKYEVLARRVSWLLRLGTVAAIVTLVLLVLLGPDSAAASVAGIVAIVFLMYAVGLKDADTMIYRAEHKDEKKSG